MTLLSKRELFKTQEGSFTFYIPSLNEYYHSWFGAVQESLYVYIKQGLCHYLEHYNKKKIRLLEVGFGTGLNAILSFLEMKKHPLCELEYVSLEPYPLSLTEVNSLSYPETLALEKKDKLIFNEMHSCPFEECFKISSFFYFHKKKVSLLDFSQLELSSYDIVYFDAFSPTVQPELWTLEVFNYLYRIMRNNAILTTYASKGIVKQAIKEAHFILERLPGSPRKHHMLRALKP